MTVAQPDRGGNLQRVIGTLLLAVPMAIVTGQKQAGFLVFLWLVPFVAWLVHAIVVMVRQPEERTPRAIRIAIWFLAFLAIGVMHAHWAHVARDKADAVAAAIVDFQTRNGRYPASLAEAGQDEASLRRSWRLGYQAKADRPFLFYVSTFAMFETYSYDFERREWNFNPD